MTLLRKLLVPALSGALFLSAAGTYGVPALYAQTAVTGAVTGVVTDPTGALLPGAMVKVTDPGTGEVKTAKADSQARYSVGLLKPGTYAVSAAFDAFKSNTVNVAVQIDFTTENDIHMVPAGSTAVVDVNAATVPLLDTQNIALVTTLTQQQIQDLPAPGGDVTTIAFTLPGVVVNAGGSYGNFSSDGLPGISNLFVLNGFDNQDPFLNLNNSGSSNLTLGQGELQEASVVQNAYNSQFGRAAGAIINYTTKSGTNQFHGMLDYYNNTSVMNANGWFNNFLGGPRPHAVSNQWAANLGGRILKDKLFFFVDDEGLRYVLPGTSGLVNFPTPQLQAYTLANVPAGALSLYQQAFAAYQSAPSYNNATPTTTGPGAAQDKSGNLGCGSLAGTKTGSGGTFGVDTPCIMTAFGSSNNINKETLFTGRLDYVINDHHTIYGRYKMDRGSQPTSTSFINPLFDATSIQPEYEGQGNDTLVITPHLTNVFVMAGNWYSAYFGPASNSASAALYPDFLSPDLGFDGSGVNTNSGLTGLGVPYYLTQGRDVTQYQFDDDLSYVHGKNVFKTGFNFRRDLISDYDSQIETIFPNVTFFQLSDYTSGQFSAASPYYGFNSFQQSFTSQKTAHLALYNIGVYFQDELQATSKLKLTLGARIDRTGNPLCTTNCFSQYSGGFPASTASLTAPYTSASPGGSISPSNAHPFNSVQTINFQPRVGFNYLLDPHTEIRGGFGLFSDLYPATFLDAAIQNFPNYNTVNVLTGVYGAGQTGTARGDAAAANAALVAGFARGQSVTAINNTLTAQGIPFQPPSLGAYFASEFKIPEYGEYSLQVQHQFGRSNALILTYAGNVGFDELLINPYVNPASGQYNNASGTYVLPASGELGGYGATPADPRFTRVTAYTNQGHSNYNGFSTQLKHTGAGLVGQISYTYSHSLDDISNGGAGLGYNAGSVLNQLTPDLSTNNLNYSNSDYDIRHNLVGDIDYEEQQTFTNPFLKAVAAGWIVGGKGYYRSGQPFSIINTTVLGNYPNMGTTLMPDLVVAKATNTCNTDQHAAVLSPCLLATDYATTQTDFGNFHRNSLYGPHYMDFDLSITKDLYSNSRFRFMLGGTAFNLLNHPNFGQPNGALGTATFGLITSTLAPPTSPYGSFQGAAVTQRVIQVHGKITF